MKARDLIIFVAGCAVGGVGASLYLKDVYRRYAQEEIDSIIEREENRCERCDRYDDTCEDVEEPTNEAIEQAQEAAKNNANKSSITEYANVIEKEGYKDYSAISKPESKEEKSAKEEPISYIPPSEFGAEGEYEQIELTYYADGILADDEGEVVSDVAASVGWEFDEHFGEFEETTVYVKNDTMKAYYVVAMSEDEYAEVFDV